MVELRHIAINDYKFKIKDKHYDKVFINANELQNLGFKEKLTELNRPILSISNGKNKIYRKFLQGSNYGISKNEIGILKRDFNVLKMDKNTKTLKVKIAGQRGVFLFYIKNPKQDIRIAARIFLLSIPLGLFLSILGAWIYDFFK